MPKQSFLKISLSNPQKFWIGFIIGIFFLYLAVRNTELGKVQSLISEAVLFPLVLSFVIRIATLWIKGYRWQVVLRPIKHISPALTFRILSIGELGNYLLPTRIGEIIRIMLIAQKSAISKVSALASVFVDRLLDLVMVLLLLFASSFLFQYPAVINKVSVAAGAILLALLILLMLDLRFNSELHGMLATIFGRLGRVSQMLNSTAERFSRGIIILKHTGKVLQALALSAILWLLYSVSFYFVLQSLKIDLPWYASLVTIITIGLAQAIPSSAGYIGTTEFFAVATLSAFSLDKSTALACALVTHVIQYLAIIVTGLLCYFWESFSYISVNDVRRFTFSSLLHYPFKR